MDVANKLNKEAVEEQLVVEISDIIIKQLKIPVFGKDECADIAVRIIKHLDKRGVLISEYPVLDANPYIPSSTDNSANQTEAISTVGPTT